MKLKHAIILSFILTLSSGYAFEPEGLLVAEKRCIGDSCGCNFCEDEPTPGVIFEGVNTETEIDDIIEHIETRLTEEEIESFQNFFLSNIDNLDSKIFLSTELLIKENSNEVCIRTKLDSTNTLFLPNTRCFNFDTKTDYILTKESNGFKRANFISKELDYSLNCELLELDFISNATGNYSKLAAWVPEKGWKKRLRSWLGSVCELGKKTKKISKAECFNDAMKAVKEKFPGLDLSQFRKNLKKSCSGAVAYDTVLKDGRKVNIRLDFPHKGADPLTHAPGSCVKPHIDITISGRDKDGDKVNGAFEYIADPKTGCWKWIWHRKKGK